MLQGLINRLLKRTRYLWKKNMSVWEVLKQDYLSHTSYTRDIQEFLLTGDQNRLRQISLSLLHSRNLFLRLLLVHYLTTTFCFQQVKWSVVAMCWFSLFPIKFKQQSPHFDVLEAFCLSLPPPCFSHFSLLHVNDHNPTVTPGRRKIEKQNVFHLFSGAERLQEQVSHYRIIAEAGKKGVCFYHTHCKH